MSLRAPGPANRHPYTPREASHRPGAMRRWLPLGCSHATPLHRNGGGQLLGTPHAARAGHKQQLTHA